MSETADILERLRTVRGCTQKTFLHSLDWAEGRQIIEEAAAEIERLRAAQFPTPQTETTITIEGE